MANQKYINLKSEAVDDLAKKMAEAKSYVLCEYAGLTVQKMEELRALLRKENCVLKVATNNTIKRASAKDGFDQLKDTEGPSCIVMSYGESVDGPRILSQFAKKNKQLVMKDGVVDKQYFNKKEMAQIANLPSKQVLLAMVAGGLYQPLQQLALGLNMIANGEGAKKATEVAA